MKISVSLPVEDVNFLDELAKAQGEESRSAVLHRAVRLLRAQEMAHDYAAAWDDWQASGDQDDWERTVADGTSDTRHA